MWSVEIFTRLCRWPSQQELFPQNTISVNWISLWNYMCQRNRKGSKFMSVSLKNRTQSIITYLHVNPFPHKDSFWRLCSRRLCTNMVTKEEIAKNEQFLLLSQCFQLNVFNNWTSFKGSFQIVSGMFSKSSAAELLYVGKG